MSAKNKKKKKNTGTAREDLKTQADRDNFDRAKAARLKLINADPYNEIQPQPQVTPTPGPTDQPQKFAASSIKLIPNLPAPAPDPTPSPDPEPDPTPDPAPQVAAQKGFGIPIAASSPDDGSDVLQTVASLGAKAQGMMRPVIKSAAMYTDPGQEFDLEKPEILQDYDPVSEARSIKERLYSSLDDVPRTQRPSWDELQKIINDNNEKDDSDNSGDDWKVALAPLAATVIGSLFNGLGGAAAGAKGANDAVQNYYKQKAEKKKAGEDKGIKAAALRLKLADDAANSEQKERNSLIDRAVLEMNLSGHLSDFTANKLKMQFGIEGKEIDNQGKMDVEKSKEKFQEGLEGYKAEMQRQRDELMNEAKKNLADNKNQLDKELANIRNQYQQGLLDLKKSQLDLEERLFNTPKPPPQLSDEDKAVKQAEADKLRAEADAIRKGKGKGVGGAGAVKPEKTTSDQFKVAGFAHRLMQADDIFDNMVKGGYDRTNRVQQGIYHYSPESLYGHDLKEWTQAERNFLTAVLRRESGAAISDTEFDTGEKQYFPRPGDDAQTLANKAANRKQVIESFKAEAGPAFGKIPHITAPNVSGSGNAPKKARSLEEKKALLKTLQGKS